MKNILLHGLGQNNESWNEIQMYLQTHHMPVICPNLFAITKHTKDYKNIYESFSDMCQNQHDKLNLCGLSLGGILALDYAKQHPEQVNSIIIIGTPFQIPKVLFHIQMLVFHLMPKHKFEAVCDSKQDFLTLLHSMYRLDIQKDLDNIHCKCLILCGDKDYANKKSAAYFQKCIKGSIYQVILDSSHEVNTENPKELADIIYHFWK